MIQFEYPRLDDFSQEVWERLMKLSLAHQVKIKPELLEPQLQEGEQIYQGKEAIHTFLDRLAAEIQDWYACTCDDWEGIVD